MTKRYIHELRLRLGDMLTNYGRIKDIPSYIIVDSVKHRAFGVIATPDTAAFIKNKGGDFGLCVMDTEEPVCIPIAVDVPLKCLTVRIAEPQDIRK